MLDTDISSYIMKRSHPSVLKRLGKAAITDTCISVITQSELMFGVEVSPRKDKDRSALEEYLRHVTVVDYTAQAATHYAQIRGYLQHHGIMIGAHDLLIAAHARSLAFTLVTHNTKEFRRVPGLKIEDWT